MVSLQRGFEQMGALRTAAVLARLNQRNGFDCPGCAWPEEHGGRKLAEFCENGAKAVAEEATKRTVTPEFFARHSVAELSAKPEYWLSQQGRLTHPMVLRPGDDHYRPIGWDAAYRLIADQLGALDSPDEAVFYTSGRTSNEAAFCYQLLVRSFGTNNLPDCSNMCHESSGSALTESIGIGKGSVTVEDVELADLIVIAGQNPGTNHPRMLSVLEKAKANGANIIAVNPLPEAGLIRFKDPQRCMAWSGTASRSPTNSCRSAWAATWRCSPGWAGCCWRPMTAPRGPSSTPRSSTRIARGSTNTGAEPSTSTSTTCSPPPASNADSSTASPTC